MNAVSPGEGAGEGCTFKGCGEGCTSQGVWGGLPPLRRGQEGRYRRFFLFLRLLSCWSPLLFPPPPSPPWMALRHPLRP